MERSSAERFAREWVRAWNQRDLAAVLAHYAEDVVFHCMAGRGFAVDATGGGIKRCI